ncbi:hypothetical protein M409DRAFT_22334 [Zasmidium cellare ATCC 36951]|uniref:Extracellular membrane protein CFEM domain-containing protein n=1 Tax=Zasmidium cellare ATCC 36951 TaxID=1080233 RepID=A0A6A6CPY5_ZASCE|nr:uncharacterized protein M409DRAFT_22334 [Zasmidium cellare ATCC 36951]KAF2167526.1 hypothetical protein M409DRAFT_22334 [Zasmidium cellare ATCC 36951]
MKQVFAATALLTTLAAASPQWGNPNGNNNNNNGGNWGNGGPFAAFPSCVSSCRDQNQDWSNADSVCDNNDAINNLNNCVNGSQCSDQEKNDVRQAIAQLCANAGATITAAPFASYSVTSGKWDNTNIPQQWSSWASANSISNWPTATSEWQSWASANNLPTATGNWNAWASSHNGGWGGAGRPGPWATGGDWSSAAGEFSSWTAANTITALPTAASQWSTFTSAYPLPSGLSSFGDWASANGFPGGSAWPTQWTTNSAWASAVSAWGGDANGGPGGPGGPIGWHGGAGPFGGGGPGGNGWGPGAWGSSGAWTSGPWTSWWGTNGCPASTWSGWTDGPWSTSAPWTTWSGCVASTTASQVFTQTTVSNGNSITAVSTSFGVRVAEQTNDLSTSTVSTTNSDSGAMPTNMAFAGSAAGMIGVVAGALLL